MKKISKIVQFSLILFFPFFTGCFRTGKTFDLKNQKIQNAHLTQGWYSQNQDNLNRILEIYFEIAKDNFNVSVDNNSIRALIAPHAGMYYSGLCAASCYRCLLENDSLVKNKKINKVIILAPSHVRYFEGICLPSYVVYKTVLGELFVDLDDINVLRKCAIFKEIEDMHEREHSIEIQLPFLQKTIESFKIIPLIVGNIRIDQYEEIVNSLKKVIDENSLIVISSDFIHHGENYSYDVFGKDILNMIRFVDSSAIEAITQKSFNNFNIILQNTSATICGQNAIKILLKLFDNVLPDLSSRLSCYYTSAQMKSAHNANGGINTEKLLEILPDDLVSNSVSYVGLLFTTQQFKDIENKNRLTEFEKRSLLNLSRDAIKNHFSKNKLPQHLLWPIKSLGLSQYEGAFVTLNTKNGDLRGCIGRTIAHNPLYETVYNMSLAAAFEDTRFKPLEEKELNDVVIDVSVLTSPKKIDNYNDIVLGRDGIILTKMVDGRQHSAVFLPQVPLSFRWDLPETLKNLSVKAGLGQEGWKQNCNYFVFQGYEINENDFR